MELFNVLTTLGSVGAFSFAVFKYLRTQTQLEKNKRFEQYRQVFEWVAGRTAGGNTLVDTQQAIAVYQLSEFSEYREMSLPIIEYYLKQTSNDVRPSLFRDALLFTHDKLSN